MSELTRRQLLAGVAGVAGAAVAGAVGAKAQVTGIMAGGGTVPLRRPLGSLDFLDRKQYISNMEIVSFTPGVTIWGGEPLMNMWARGRQRLINAEGAWLDVTDPKKPVVVKASARVGGCVVYNT